MRYGMFTINKSDIEEFKDLLPEFVLENCSKRGIFMIGAANEDMRLLGLTQFYISMMSEGNFCSDIVYVYVAEAFRGKGIASKMLKRVHSIMKKSGVEKSLAFLGKKQQEQQLFKENGYLFMKAEAAAIEKLEEVHERIVPARTEQGVFWIDR